MRAGTGPSHWLPSATSPQTAAYYGMQTPGRCLKTAVSVLQGCALVNRCSPSLAA